MTDDLFDGALSLEDDLYTQGYNQGFQDGERAGKIEGRSVGMAKGFEKFAESGRLYGRSVVWANRLMPSENQTQESNGARKEETENGGVEDGKVLRLPALPQNARLAKNVESVHALMEPGTLSTENSDDAVQDFDDRLRKAQGKVRVIERMIGTKTSREGEA